MTKKIILLILTYISISGCSDRPGTVAIVEDNSWTLTACVAASSWGCGSVFRGKYPTEDSCYRAVNQINQNKSTLVESNLRRDVVATCEQTNLNYRGQE